MSKKKAVEPQKQISDLSQSEKDDLRSKRKIFNDLYSCFSENELIDAEIELTELDAMITGLFMSMDTKVKVKDLEVPPIPEEKKDKITYVLSLLNDLSISEACTYLRGLQNSIEHHKRIKTKDWKIKELDIVLLSTDF